MFKGLLSSKQLYSLSENSEEWMEIILHQNDIERIIEFRNSEDLKEVFFL